TGGDKNNEKFGAKIRAYGPTVAGEHNKRENALAALRPRDTGEGCRGPLSGVKTPHLNFTQKLSSAPGPPQSQRHRRG
ncbi:MAG: hypothetical protein ABSG53_21900, partial [Thermoguttaceae bacterium]